MSKYSSHGDDADSVSDVAGMEEVVQRVRAITAENDRLFQRLLEGEKRFRRLAKAVWKVQEEERRRLALELHDGIGQTLTALKNHLQRQRSRSNNPEQLAGIEQALELATIALSDTREMSRLLRPPVLDDLGLQAALNWLARIHRQRAGLRVDVGWHIDAERLDPELETLVFRAVQEALTNVLKHAGSDWVTVSVCNKESFLEVVVEDGGTGFDPALVAESGGVVSGFGLRGLRDRVELFGGTLRIDGRDGGGARLHFLLPQTDGAADVGAER